MDWPIIMFLECHLQSDACSSSNSSVTAVSKCLQVLHPEVVGERQSRSALGPRAQQVRTEEKLWSFPLLPAVGCRCGRGPSARHQRLRDAPFPRAVLNRRLVADMLPARE